MGSGMHTVELLARTLEFAESIGYEIRQEYLGGVGGGACEFSGRKWIFVDLALNAADQLDEVVRALQEDPAAATLPIPELQPIIQKSRQAA